MTGKTLTDRVNELDRLVAVLLNRMGYAEAEIQRLLAGGRESDQRTYAQYHEAVREIALLKHQVEELKLARKELGERFWKFAIPLGAGVVGALALAALGLKRP